MYMYIYIYIHVYIYIYIYNINRNRLELGKTRKLVLPNSRQFLDSFIAFTYTNICLNSICSSLFYYIHPVLRD